MGKRGLGEYVPLSVSYMDDDALLGVQPLAELLYVRMLALAGQLTTDGYLTRPQVLHRAGARLGPPAKVEALLRELVRAGPVEETDGGFVLRAWLKWNKSAEELGREKARDRERKRAERSGRPPDGDGNPPGVHPVSDRTTTGQPPDSTGNPNGIQPESERSPVSRAPTYAQHGTARHGTITEPSVPRADESGPDVPPDEPPGAEVIPIGAASAVTAQTLVGEWLDHCANRPPGRVVGQTSKELRALLAEGMPEDAIRRGLADWHRRGQHPSTLPSFVNAAMNAAGPSLPARPRSTTDDRVAAGLEMVAKYAALERGDAG